MKEKAWEEPDLEPPLDSAAQGLPILIPCPRGLGILLIMINSHLGRPLFCRSSTTLATA
jgi:hypothetical protein